MAVREYIGARYVPIFADPEEWDSTRVYEPLTIVQYQGASYTSKQAVPKGIDIGNSAYWALTGNYNAQVEQYRQEVRTFDNRITAAQEAADVANDTALSAIADIATEADAREAADTQLSSDIAAETQAREDAIATEAQAREDAIAAEAQARESADTQLSEDIAAEAQVREDAVAALRRDVSEMHIIGDYYAPGYVGSYMSNSQFGCCVRVDRRIYTFNPWNNGSNTGNMRIFDMDANRDIKGNVEREMGHANSCAHDAARNQIVVAGLINGTVGSSSPNPYIYRFDLNGNANGTYQIDNSKPVLSVSYDHVNNILYAFNWETDAKVLGVHRMLEGETSFTRWKNIDMAFLKTEDDPTYQLYQDIAVWDGIAYLCKVEGSTYIIDLEAEKLVGTARVGSMDIGSRWRYGEHEGWEFDAAGNLYQARNCPCGVRNSGTDHDVNANFVTSINTKFNIDSMLYNDRTIYGTLNLSNATRDKFMLSRGEINSINQLMWYMVPVSQVTIAAGDTYSEGVIKTIGDVRINLQGTMRIDKWEHHGGTLTLGITGDGVLNITRKSGVTDTGALSLDRSGQLQLRYTGTWNISGFTQHINSGSYPLPIFFTGVSGKTITTNNHTNCEPGCILMGGYKFTT